LIHSEAIGLFFEIAERLELKSPLPIKSYPSRGELGQFLVKKLGK
jgi:hypothetical protein